jgi:glutamate-ammonia-ligase adenylyltransferase
VARVARGLRSLGVGRGDRVAALLPNVPEAVIGLLATASLGAIWSSCSPDFGARSVIDRFAQIEPKVLIACDGYGYNGKEYPRTQMRDEVLAELPGPPAVVMVSLLARGDDPPQTPPAHGGAARPPIPPGPPGTGGRLAATGEALTDITRASLQAALAVALRKVSAELRRPLPTRFAVIAMGRFGGHECGYGSDADVLFVHDPLPGRPEKEASDAAHAIAAELRRLLMLPVPDPALIVDADLRPEGRQGPLVRTLASYRAYYRRWSAPWEAQALLRAEFGAGDEDLGARFTRMIAEFRYPLDGISPAGVREIRRIKARMEAERIPRGADRARHVKLGPGGLSDVEWTIQLLQLQHAHAVPALRTTRTGSAMAAAVQAGLLAAEDAAQLTAAWELAARIRNAIVLVGGRPGDTLPAKHSELTAVARLLGYPPGDAAQALEQDYRRAARHARAVMERLFYD